MKIVVFGAGGIIGQTMRLVQPRGHEIIYYRRHADFLHRGLDLTDWKAAEIALNFERPDLIVNLAGENRPDVVEQHPGEYQTINVQTPGRISRWCDAHNAYYVHISSQAVFRGDYWSAYSPDSELLPINEYGRQKAEAERLVKNGRNWTIIRPTLVLGIRPLPHIGRQNPLEQMLANLNGQQVNDRWFSPICAKELATVIWEQVLGCRTGIVHAGRPVTVSRHSIAGIVGGNPQPVAHSYFQCAAERAFDTTYAKGALHDQTMSLEEALMDAIHSAGSKAEDLALFFGLPLQTAEVRLNQGFGPLHNEVTKDFERVAPKTDEELLDWYHRTEAYIWELTAYHRDPGFNYEGICDGVATRLQGADGEILCVGDGVGQLTLRLREAALRAVYHDLSGSRTAEFAQFRLWRRFGAVGPTDMSSGWEPRFQEGRYAAVVCLDFLEHVTDVPAWLRALHGALRPAGIALFQNAFGLGSGEHGGMPMHLERNDRYVTEYTALMSQLGWKQISTSNWWQKAEAKEQAA